MNFSIPYHPRILNWIIAHLGGYFWQPCPICGKNFGGHEWPLGEYLFRDGKFMAICPNLSCILEARRRNAEIQSQFNGQLIQRGEPK